MPRLALIISVLAAAADAAVYGLEEDLPDAAAAPKDYKLPEKVRHMDGPPPGIDLSSLSVKPNIIKQPAMPKINRNDGLGDDDPLPPLDKCDACFVLWRSMEGVLEAEPKMDKDRTDVLAGGRLDSRGAQTGTKHSYATSEVRAARLVERVCEFVNVFRYNAQGAYWVRDKALVAAFEAGKALPKPRQLGRLPTDELRVSLVNYCSTTVEDHEDEIMALLLAGGLGDAGRAAFCSGTRKDCRGDAVEAAAKRQGIADILAGINDEPPAAPAKKKRRRKKKKKPVAAEL
ncbi:unnamed protein product [Pelagomonas calceolata]|uniref:DUF3456 domain-containing protein n=1 Tax=Pelagomonas calceolata TaxID=35677 RepID=A0A8J2WUK0_9STRA|nr:unnamed protein product [Pelagomonas calceolata]